LVVIEAVVGNQISEVVENDSEKDIGVITARNGYNNIQLKGASKIRMLQSANMATDMNQSEIMVTRAARPRIKA
jgi:hypothetical protein